VIKLAVAAQDWQALWEETIAESSYNKRRADLSETDWINFFIDSCWKNEKNHFNSILNFDALLSDEDFLVEFDKLKRFVNRDSTVIDIGAGIGRLAIPIARIADKVTVLEPSKTNLMFLQENAKRTGVNNLVYAESLWSDFAIHEKYDLVFSVWSPAIRDPSSLLKMHQASKGYCALVTSAAPYGNTDFLDHVYPLIRNEPYNPIYSYIHIMSALNKHGIYPNVETWNAHAEITHENMDKALNYWKAFLVYYSDVTEEMEEKLRQYYQSRMNPDGTYNYSSNGVACMIWWHV